MRNSLSRLTITAMASLLALTACGSDASTDQSADGATVSFVDAWSREPVAGQTTSAVYGQIVNNGDATVTAVAVRTSVTDRAELHEVLVDDDGSMTMQQRDGGFDVPAGGSLTLEPGSFHVMLMGIDPATYPDTVELEVEFDDGTTVDVVAPVRPIGNEMEMDDAEE